MSGLRVVPVSTQADWRAALAIRQTVFVGEQGVSEQIESTRQDLDCIHVLATLDGTPVGTGRLIIEKEGPLPTVPDAEAVARAHLPREASAERLPRLAAPSGPRRGRIGRMAVLKEHRREGVGKLLLTSLEANAWRNGVERVILEAQEAAIPFYTALGYRTLGERFQEAGIWHQWMEKPRVA